MRQRHDDVQGALDVFRQRASEGPPAWANEQQREIWRIAAIEMLSFLESVLAKLPESHKPQAVMMLAGATVRLLGIADGLRHEGAEGVCPGCAQEAFEELGGLYGAGFDMGAKTAADRVRH